MSIFSAIIKTGLTAMNNHCYRNAQRKAHKTAYAETGKQLRNAKAHGRFVNGSVAYNRNKAVAMQKAEERKNLRQTFIDNI